MIISISATVNLSLFNGGLTTAQIGEQKANLANLKFNEDVLRQNIALEVRQDVLNLHQADESIRVSALHWLLLFLTIHSKSMIWL